MCNMNAKKWDIFKYKLKDVFYKKCILKVQKDYHDNFHYYYIKMYKVGIHSCVSCSLVSTHREMIFERKGSDMGVGLVHILQWDKVISI